ncbi:retinoic acid early-inducible protein 1-alpha-like [Microtus pennsylvanicus]|uniref:retinoic acid early-inducible protein 1-alpha-like n=1 Tax=Microtus pennsylvanicus TaxID=10058 RepID=UPI003F6CE33D
MLANSKQEITKIGGQPTLQATMLSQYEHGQIVGASWRFNISGKYCFIFNTMNMNWILIGREAGVIMNTWKDHEQFIKDLKIISTADCRQWLNELLKYQKEKPSRYYQDYQGPTPSHLIDWGGQKKSWNPLELELQVILIKCSPHMG